MLLLVVLEGLATVLLFGNATPFVLVSVPSARLTFRGVWYQHGHSYRRRIPNALWRLAHNHLPCNRRHWFLRWFLTVVLQLLVMLVESHENAFAFGRYQTLYNFLGYVLCAIVEQLFQLQVSELLYHLFFPLDLWWVHCLELLDFILFFKLVLNQAAPSMKHLVEAVLESRCHRLPWKLTAGLWVSIRLICVVPYIVRDKSFDATHRALR